MELAWNIVEVVAGSIQLPPPQSESRGTLCEPKIGLQHDSIHTINGTVFTRLSLATSMRRKEKGGNEYKTRTEWQEIHAHSILALVRSDRQPVSAPESEPADEPLD
jgi:hypothetical protein